MTVELWHAILNPHGPKYAAWHEIFGENRVPLKSCQSLMAELGPEKNVEVYMLDLAALDLKQRAKLLSSVARRFNVPIYEVEQEIDRIGFPIRAADLIVSYDMRAFV